MGPFIMGPELITELWRLLVAIVWYGPCLSMKVRQNGEHVYPDHRHGAGFLSCKRVDADFAARTFANFLAIQIA